MLTDIFLIHPLKSFIRNGRLKRTLLSYIIFIITLVYLFVFLLYIGSHLNAILTFNGENPIVKFNSLILYYLLIDLIIRIFFKKRRGLNLIPYLRCPIKRSVIINYIIVQNLFDFINLVPLFFIIPFSWKIIYLEYGIMLALNYQLFLTIAILINCYLASIIKLIIHKNITFIWLPIIILISILIKSFRQQIINISGSLGEQIINFNYFLLIFQITFLVIIIATLKYLYAKSFYLEDSFRVLYNKKPFAVSLQSNFFKNSITWSYFILELKLLIRNKRTIQTLIIFPVLPVLLFMNILNNEHNIFLELMAFILIFGFFPVLYGQNLFNWESTFFDGKMARENYITSYLCSKFYLMFFVSILILLFTMVLIFIKNEYPMLYISIFLFVNGIVNIFVIFIGTFNKSRINLNEHFFLNYQGLSVLQLILPILILILPMIFLKILEIFFGIKFIILICCLSGGFLIILHKLIIRNFIKPFFLKRKYINMEGFRKLYE